MADPDRNDGSLRSQGYDSEIDLAALFRILWAGKWLIVSFTVVAAVVAVTVALLLPNIYRAEALLAPNQDDGAGGLSALAAQYGGLASLAGINLGGGSANKTALGLEVLKSRKFISGFIERHDLLVPLMAAEGWDPKSGELKIDPDIFDALTKKWVRDVTSPKTTVPSLLEAYDYFSDEILSIRQDKETGFVVIGVQHFSPIVAKEWVDWLIQDINTTFMRQEVDDAEQAIEYLKKQIAATSLTDLQNVFYRLIEEQTKTVMLAKVSDEYLLRTLDPAVAPENKVGPLRVLIVLGSAALAGFLAMLSVLIMGARDDSRLPSIDG